MGRCHEAQSQSTLPTLVQTIWKSSRRSLGGVLAGLRAVFAGYCCAAALGSYRLCPTITWSSCWFALLVVVSLATTACAGISAPRSANTNASTIGCNLASASSGACISTSYVATSPMLGEPDAPIPYVMPPLAYTQWTCFHPALCRTSRSDESSKVCSLSCMSVAASNSVPANGFNLATIASFCVSEIIRGASRRSSAIILSFWDRMTDCWSAEIFPSWTNSQTLQNVSAIIPPRTSQFAILRTSGGPCSQIMPKPTANVAIISPPSSQTRTGSSNNLSAIIHILPVVFLLVLWMGGSILLIRAGWNR